MKVDSRAKWIGLSAVLAVGSVGLLFADLNVPANVWSLFGNLNSDPSSDYLGTADAVDLSIRTDGIERLRIAVDGVVSVHDGLSVDDGLTVVGGGLDVTGPTELDALNVSGMAEIPGLNTSNLTFNDITMGGTTTVEILTITGGMDIAEPFEVLDEEAEPGMVVAIDPARAGVLKIADRAYDPAVAGIISGANGIGTGMVLAQQGIVSDGNYNVALSGRVWCWVDADANGPVRPGDMLTASATPGHAMKATDRQRAFGSLVGKAMTGVEEGRGLALVLVGLQ